MSSSDPDIGADGTDVDSVHVEGMHLTRFVEIFLAHRAVETGTLVAECYNTMFTRTGIPSSKDTAPSGLVDRLDVERLKDEYAVLGAWLNGPKLWLPEWCDIDRGLQRDFDGLAAAWVARLHLGGAGGTTGAGPYEPRTIARNSSLGWGEGTRSLLLDDADGTTWIMKGFQLGRQPQRSYEEFLSAGADGFEQLPPGWNVRVEVLPRELIETPENGTATIMADEHFNVYDKTGPGMSDYTP